MLAESIRFKGGTTSSPSPYWLAARLSLMQLHAVTLLQMGEESSAFAALDPLANYLGGYRMLIKILPLQTLSCFQHGEKGKGILIALLKAKRL